MFIKLTSNEDGQQMFINFNKVIWFTWTGKETFLCVADLPVGYSEEFEILVTEPPDQILALLNGDQPNSATHP